MADDLGHIDIRFPNVPGGGAGDTTGPLPAKQSIGAMVSPSSIVKGGMAAFASSAMAVVGSLTSAIMDTVARISDFIQSGIAKMQEGGRFSPAVIAETINLRMQALQQQFQEAQVLGPLYATILKWYRELMALIQPWRLVFSALMSAVVGGVLITLKAFMQVVNKGLDSVLTALISLFNIIAKFASAMASSDSRYTMVAQGFRGNLVGAVGAAYSATLADVFPKEVVDFINKIADEVGKAAQGVAASLTQLQAINNNTKKPPTQGLDWAGAELRQLASQSVLYGTGSGYSAKAPFFYPAGSLYPRW